MFKRCADFLVYTALVMLVVSLVLGVAGPRLIAVLRRPTTSGARP